jgi:hypothetical protein
MVASVSTYSRVQYQIIYQALELERVEALLLRVLSVMSSGITFPFFGCHPRRW